jgi:sulfate transport system substrate-binding protein
MVTIENFGGWTVAQPAFFGEGGVFDQIYQGR